jgi:hypothetical protein
MAKVPTDAYLQEIFEDHLPYEITMLRWGCRAAGSGILEGNMQNAAIECFWLHARNLMEFFKKGHQNRYCSGTPFEAFVGSAALVEALTPRINNQIAHVIFDKRTSATSEKLDWPEVTACHQLIETELAKFTDHLDQRWQPKWGAVVFVQTTRSPSATNTPETLRETGRVLTRPASPQTPCRRSRRRRRPKA